MNVLEITSRSERCGGTTWSANPWTRPSSASAEIVPERPRPSAKSLPTQSSASGYCSSTSPRNSSGLSIESSWVNSMTITSSRPSWRRTRSFSTRSVR